MRVVIQRTSGAKVIVDNEVTGKIKMGLVVLVGVSDEDDRSDVEWLVNKILNLRIFPDSEGKMNLSIIEAGGQLLIISQFTLYASIKKGNRPSYLRSARPDFAVSIYNKFIKSFSDKGIITEKGIFGANMKVHLINDGPVTIVIDTKDKE